MIESVEFLIEKLSNQADTNQCVISHNDKCYKVKRENYFPDNNGRVVFHKKGSWVSDGYSVYEMRELLKSYGEMISEVLFEGSDGKEYKLINIFEVNNLGVEMEYSCLLIIGNAGDPMKVYHNPEDENWMTGNYFYHHL